MRGLAGETFYVVHIVSFFFFLVAQHDLDFSSPVRD